MTNKLRKLAFCFEGLIYTSDSFVILKNKVLELGAHRIGNEPGTGIDVRKIIHETTPLIETLGFPIADLDELSIEEIEEELEKEYGKIRDPDAEDFVGWADFEDPEYDVYTNESEELDSSVRAIEDPEPSTPWLEDDELGTFLEEAQHPIQGLLESNVRLIAALAVDLPATAGDISALASLLAEDGDVAGSTELNWLLREEANFPKRGLVKLDAFTLAQYAKRDESEELFDGPSDEELWIGAPTKAPDPEIAPQVGDRILAPGFPGWDGAVVTATDGVGRFPIEVKRRDGSTGLFTLDEVRVKPQSRLSADDRLLDFKFACDLDSIEKQYHLANQIFAAVMIERRTFTLSPPVGDTKNALYVVEEEGRA